MTEYGFKLNDYPGNMEVVMLRTALENLQSEALDDYRLCVQGDWCTLVPKNQYQRESYIALAIDLSKKWRCQSILFQFGDASGHIECDFYEQGERIEGYSYGPDYSEEMAEYGAPLREAKAHETLVRDGDSEYVYFNPRATQSEIDISGGDDFLDQRFQVYEALLSWESLGY